MEGRSYLGIGIAIGLAIGSAIGVAMDNLAVGIGAGMAIGVAIGLAMDARKRRKPGASTGESSPPPADRDSE